MGEIKVGTSPSLCKACALSLSHGLPFHQLYELHSCIMGEISKSQRRGIGCCLHFSVGTGVSFPFHYVAVTISILRVRFQFLSVKLCGVLIDERAGSQNGRALALTERQQAWVLSANITSFLARSFLGSRC